MNNNDDKGDKCPPSPTLKSNLGDLSEEDLLALLKSMNIEVKIKTEDENKAYEHDSVKSLPTIPSQNQWSNINPSAFAPTTKLQSGLLLRTTSYSGNKLSNVKAIISKAQ
jgi:hypothetical protein